MTDPIPRERLLAMHCVAAPAGGRLDPTNLDAQLDALPGWTLRSDTLVRSFAFDNYDRTIEFVNAVAAIARREDHHPELRVGYDRCEVCWSTHSVNGVSLNDLVCAALTDRVADDAGGRPVAR